MKKLLFQTIENEQDKLSEISNFIFDNPEYDYKEYKASKLLTDYLEDLGFQVELGIAGLDTAFKAVYEQGHGGPSIGLLTEYDAISGMGHACAHHLQGPVVLGATKALKENLKDFNYKIVVYGTPAEETTGGKLYMVDKDCFKDIDVALMFHGADTTTTDIKSLAMSTYTVNFKGISSHAAISPHKGRSAMDGLLLAFNGIEFLREHVLEDTRMHYTVLQANPSENVVPDFASAKFNLRSYNRSYLDTVIKRFEKVIAGAAMMTETEYEIISDMPYDSKIPVLSLNNILMDNARLVDAPTIRPAREKTGSTDFGNIMYRVPGSCIRVAFVEEGISSHSDDYLKSGKSEGAHKAIAIGAKILAATSYDLIKDKELFKSVKEEFLKNKEISNNF